MTYLDKVHQETGIDKNLLISQACPQMWLGVSKCENYRKAKLSDCRRHWNQEYNGEGLK